MHWHLTGDVDVNNNLMYEPLQRHKYFAVTEQLHIAGREKIMVTFLARHQ